MHTILLTLFIICSGLFGSWILSLWQDIDSAIERRSLFSSIEYYSKGPTLKPGIAIKPNQIKSILTAAHFRQVDDLDKMMPKDWIENFFPNCPEQAQKCITVADSENPSNSKHITITWSSTDKVERIFANDATIPSWEGPPQLFAQYLDNQPIAKNPISLGKVPAACLNSVLAIEDEQFLFHKGVSVRGLLRAIWVNLRSGYFAQGGSTITQQLVKNDLLTPEKTIKRKLRELFLSLLIEYRLSKDEILELYLNTIYLGQNGPYQVRGIDAAADFYFQKKIEDLTLPECALIAAVVNSPGHYNPFLKPENARARRGLVLEKMLSLNMISNQDKESANSSALPNRIVRPTQTAPFFIDMVSRELDRLDLPRNQSLRIYTTLNLEAQLIAQRSVTNHIEKLGLKKLQGTFVAIDNQSGSIVALVGGTSFRQTQFNRVLDAKRQAGSTFKPIVFLTALNAPNDQHLSMQDEIEDGPFQVAYEGKTWTPKNYGNEYLGKVNLVTALIKSLNTATVRVAMHVGLENVLETFSQFEVESKVKPYPAMALGAFEITSLDLAKIYSTFARNGDVPDLYSIQKVEDIQHNVLYFRPPEPLSNKKFSDEVIEQLNSALHGATQRGTAQGISRSNIPFWTAGKTGTTSDYKDAWFAGFSKGLTGIAWVGFDDNTSDNLTGATGALPIWISFFETAGQQYESF